MATVMDYPESPSEEQEAVFPCKGCGDVSPLCRHTANVGEIALY